MTITPNIFKIDIQNHKLKGLSSTLAVIKAIIKVAQEKLTIETEGEDNINEFSRDDITYYLYVFNDNDKQSDWAGFLPSELKENKKFDQRKISLILFIETEYELYAVVGGSAYYVIMSFIDHSFGLNTYDKFVSVENDEMTSIKYWGITGQKIKVNEHFREDYRIINYLKFGKIPEEMSVRVAKETTNEYFGFLLDKPADRLQLTIGRSLKIKKSVVFDTLHEIAKELSNLMEAPSKDFLSSYIEVKDEKRLALYREALFDKVYNHIAYLTDLSKIESNKFEFDFCNPKKIESFYEADRFQLREKSEEGTLLFGSVNTRDEIYPAVIQRGVTLHGYDKFKLLVYFQGVRIVCFLGAKKTAESMFLYHISTELEVGGDAVFHLDNKWYCVKDVFISDLKNQTERIFRTYKLPKNILALPWPKKPMSILMEDEGVYNGWYGQEPGFIIGDELITEGVEVFDILYHNQNEFYLIHVKHGFSAKVREQTNQILISARRVSEAKAAGNKKFFGKLYDQIVNAGRGVDGLTRNDFIDLFIKREPVYVFATCSQLTRDLPIEDNINSYRSNIARFSLVTCSSEVRTNYFEMLTFQIPRS